MQPFVWLGAGAVGFGLGAAALTGAGSAHADDGVDASSSVSSETSRDDANESGSGPSGADHHDKSKKKSWEESGPSESHADVDGTETTDEADAEDIATRRDVVDVGSHRTRSGPDTESEVPAPQSATAATNTEPTAALSWQSSPSVFTGRVTGRISAADADGDPLTFAGTATTGTVAITSRGSFTYTPSASARHAAAATDITPRRDIDTFNVTVSDGRSGTVAVPVTVQIRPANSAPTWLRSTVATPDPATGQVTGRITATDRDGDTFTFTAAPPSNGAVTVHADGSFTYNASDAARHRAQTTWYTDTDRFRVTLDDGHGARRAITVRVRIAPHNSVPVAGTPTYGSPDRTTGVVGGSVTVTDPDGDRITYRLSVPPRKGALVIAADGRFTYTPTPAARHAAATGLAGTTTDAATIAAGVGV